MSSQERTLEHGIGTLRQEAENLPKYRGERGAVVRQQVAKRQRGIGKQHWETVTRPTSVRHVAWLGSSGQIMDPDVGSGDSLARGALGRPLFWSTMRLMSRTLPISEVKTHLPALVLGIQNREDEIIVTRKGRPAAVIINFDEYERLRETLDILSDPELLADVRGGRDHFRRGESGVPMDKVLPVPATKAKRRR